MPQTVGAFGCFAHSIRLRRNTPLHHRYRTYEYDAPYRTALSHVLRLPGTGRGLVVGRWENGRLEHDEAQLQALQGARLFGAGERELRITDPGYPRSGEWARFARFERNTDGLTCALVKFADGEVDLWPWDGYEHRYEIRESGNVNRIMEVEFP